MGPRRVIVWFFFFKQKTAYEITHSDWSSDVCSSDLRGFVLVGHSQGSRMLRALIRAEIDPKRVVRRRLVSAIIPGANATVARGRLAGGDFKHIPMCTRG